MPLYTYECPNCSREQTEMRLMAEREQKPLPECWKCKTETVFVLSGPPMGIVKNPAAGR